MSLPAVDVVFLMGAGFNWILHFGLPPRYAKDLKVIQLDIAPEEIGHNRPTDVALSANGSGRRPGRGRLWQGDACLRGDQGI